MKIYFLKQCCLGIEFKNPNISGKMAQLLMSNQRKYVPSITTNSGSSIVSPVPLHGDQLFEERARNVQSTFKDGINRSERLEGILTEAADWHAKVNLYSVSSLCKNIMW